MVIDSTLLFLREIPIPYQSNFFLYQIEIPQSTYFSFQPTINPSSYLPPTKPPTSISEAIVDCSVPCPLMPRMSRTMCCPLSIATFFSGLFFSNSGKILPHCHSLVSANSSRRIYCHCPLSPNHSLEMPTLQMIMLDQRRRSWHTNCGVCMKLTKQ